MIPKELFLMQLEEIEQSLNHLEDTVMQKVSKEKRKATMKVYHKIEKAEQSLLEVETVETRKTNVSRSYKIPKLELSYKTT